MKNKCPNNNHFKFDATTWCRMPKLGFLQGFCFELALVQLNAECWKEAPLPLVALNPERHRQLHANLYSYEISDVMAYKTSTCNVLHIHWTLNENSADD